MPSQLSVDVSAANTVYRKQSMSRELMTNGTRVVFTSRGPMQCAFFVLMIRLSFTKNTIPDVSLDYECLFVFVFF